MYTIAVRRDFIAQHYLIGGDWGEENQTHSHHYQLELQLEGKELDRHGYLIDIVEVERLLDELVTRYRNRCLNELPEFSGLNPSIEHFSRILCCSLESNIQAANVSGVAVRLWENDIAWAGYQRQKSLKSDD